MVAHGLAGSQEAPIGARGRGAGLEGGGGELQIVDEGPIVRRRGGGRVRGRGGECGGQRGEFQMGAELDQGSAAAAEVDGAIGAVVQAQLVRGDDEDGVF